MKTENTAAVAPVANGVWVAPISYFATVDKDGAGKFIKVPDFPELATVAEVHGADAADKLHGMIVRAFNSGYKEEGRDRISLFDKAFAANSTVQAHIRDAAKAKGLTPSDEAVQATILSPRYKNTLLARFGDEVAAAGYTPAKRNAKDGDNGALGDLEL